MPGEGDEPVVRDQDPEEGGHHQERRGRSHDDRKESFAGKHSSGGFSVKLFEQKNS